MEEEQKTTGELLNAWRDATRAAELADSLAANAADTSLLADSTADAAEQIANLAEKAAKAAERAAMTARDAAKRAADLAKSSRDKNVSGGDRAAAAHADEERARDAYHARVAEASDRQPEEDRSELPALPRLLPVPGTLPPGSAVVNGDFGRGGRI